MASASKLNRQLSDVEGRRDDLAKRVEEFEAALAQETAAHAKLKAAHLDAAEAHRLTASNLREELSAMASRSEAAERLLTEAREKLRERDAEIRGFEQRALESSLAANPKTWRWPILRRIWPRRGRCTRKSTLSARRSSSGRPSSRKPWRPKTSRGSARNKRSCWSKAASEQNKATEAERVQFEERLAKLKEQLEAEQAARSFAEGALQAARQERGSRRHDAEGAGAPPKDPPAQPNEGARDKIARLRG